MAHGIHLPVLEAIVGNDAAGAGEIVTTLLDRPEGRAVAVTGRAVVYPRDIVTSWEINLVGLN